MKTRPARAEVPVELTWNLDDLFASAADWETALEGVDAARADVSPYQGQLGTNAATLLACLDTVEALQRVLPRPRQTWFSAIQTRFRPPQRTPSGDH